MSELRRNRGPDGADTPEKIAKVDDPGRRPKLEIRTTDQIEGREVERRKVTPAQRDFIRVEKQAATSGVPRKPLTTYSMDWESGDHVNGWYDPPPRDSDDRDPSDEPDPDAVPSVTVPMPPTLQHTTATGVERLRAADIASRADQPVPDDSRADPDDHDAPATPDDGADHGDLDRAGPGNTPAVRDSPYAEPPPDFHRANADLEARTLERTEDPTGFSGFDDVKPGRRKSRGSWDKIVEKSGNVVQGVQDSADKLDHIFNPPRPTGAFVGSTPDAPQHITEQYAGHNIGDIAAAVTTVVVIAVDTSRKVHRKFDEWKDRNAGNG